MKKFKAYARLALIFALIGLGAILLAFDYKTTGASWLAVGCSSVCIAAGLWLRHIFDKHGLLPE